LLTIDVSLFPIPSNANKNLKKFQVFLTNQNKKKKIRLNKKQISLFATNNSEKN
jgi:hypothetical protein